MRMQCQIALYAKLFMAYTIPKIIQQFYKK